MKELIPSKDVRDYLKKSNHRFTDSEKATLIYNSEWSLPSKHKALLEIADLTEDTKLKQQIRERIECDKHCLQRIKGNAGGFVYKLEVWEKEDDEYYDCGIFASYNLAENYARRKCKAFQIKKLFIHNTEQIWNEEDEEK